MKSIFFIDDDPIFVYLTKRIIGSTKCECEVNEFADGELAITYLDEIRDNVKLLPDIIFLDLSMPVMDGWEFLEEYNLLRPQLKKDIALFIVSSSISPQEVERSKNYESVIDFLIKPVERSKLMEIIDDSVEKAG